MLDYTKSTSTVVVTGLSYEEFCEEHGTVKKQVVDIEIDGLKYHQFWAQDTQMKPYFLDIILDDIGIGKDKDRTEEENMDERKTVKEYCLRQLINFEYEEHLITVAEIEDAAGTFWDGYRQAKYGKHC